MKKVIAFALLLSFVACSDHNVDNYNTPEDERLVDFEDSTVFSDEILIGNQIWMNKNLDVLKFRNGDNIPIVTSNTDWVSYARYEKPACCFYQNEENNGKKYGVLYNWYAVNDARGLAPEGWRIPEVEEWNELINFLGGEIKAAFRMKQEEEWNGEMNGHNTSGFSAIPGGYRTFDSPYFAFLGDYGFWWTTSSIEKYSAYKSFIMFNSASVNILSGGKGEGLSVRCIKD